MIGKNIDYEIQYIWKTNLSGVYSSGGGLISIKEESSQLQAMPNLSEKVAIITGAGSGIGAATAKHFAKLNCCLGLSDIQEGPLKETVQKCIELGLQTEKVIAIPGDITAEDVQKQLVSKTIECFGKLDILLNVAGIGGGSKLSTLSETDLDKVMNVNFRAMLKLTQLSIPHLKTTRGNVVNVSSAATIRPLSQNMAYDVSKAAVDQFTRSAAIELAQFGIRVNSVNPGPVKTNIVVNSGGTEELSELVYDRLKDCTLLARVAEPEEIATVMAFLASDDASFVTGINMLVDGGLHLAMPKILG